MKFNKALKQLKNGQQVTRTGWENKLITLYQARVISLTVNEFKRNVYEVDFSDDDPETAKLEMKEWLDGFEYYVSSEDLLATDWKLA